MRLSRPPPTRSLRIFCVAARHCSFKFAADELFLTPSAVSHQIKELEAALGVRLFERKPRALELTHAGTTLLEQAEPLLEALDRSVAQVARGGGRRTLRIQLPPFFASELFLPRLEAFCDRHPQIDMRIDTHDPRPVVHTANADVSILLRGDPPQGMEYAHLFPLSLTAACSPAHLPAVAHLGSGVFRELALIVYKPSPDAWSNWAQEAGLDAPEPSSVLEFDTMHAVVRAAERGLGVALVPSPHCDAAFRAGTLTRIFAVELPTAEAYYLVNRARDAERPDVHAFTAWMRAQFTGLHRPDARA
jgi:LysR family glycine cleavage system transcriptional activator